MKVIFLISTVLAALGAFDEAEGLVELPQVEYNDILNTENLIRSSVNDLFSLLNLKEVKKKPRLKQYALIHNYFISLTLRDHRSLNEVARLTRVDKPTDNRTENFITSLNEVLNGDHSSEIQERNTTVKEDVDEDFVNYLDRQLRDLGYLKLNHTFFNNNPLDDNTNNEILDILSRNDEIIRLNETISKQELFDDDTLIQKSNVYVSNEQSGRRIFKGQRTKIKKYPYTAVVQMFGNFQCGGAIISSDMVLTAASCLQVAFNNRFYRENPAFISVRVGSNFYNGNGEVISVMEVYFHPSYNPKTLQNNLAGLRLRLHLFFHKWVKKIEFDKEAEPLSLTTDGIEVIGWGAKSRSNIVGNPWDNKISVDTLPFYSLKACQEIYSKEYVTEKNFCAGFNAKGGGACNRDVGNPGVVNKKLVGIVSFGSPQCGVPNHPTVFTKVGYYADWIETVLLEERPIRKLKKKTTTEKNPMNAWTTTTKKTKSTITTTTEISIQPLRLDDTPSRGQNKVANSSEELELDKETFKDFLTTMFNSSKEVQEYMDLVEETGNMQKTCKSCKVGESLKPERILESIGDRFKDDSALSETINSLKSEFEYTAYNTTRAPAAVDIVWITTNGWNNTDTKVITEKQFFNFSDIDYLYKNISLVSSESEEKKANTTIQYVSVLDDSVESSLLDILMESARDHQHVPNTTDVAFTKIANASEFVKMDVDGTKFGESQKSNDSDDFVYDHEEKGLPIETMVENGPVTNILDNGLTTVSDGRINEAQFRANQENNEYIYEGYDYDEKGLDIDINDGKDVLEKIVSPKEENAVRSLLKSIQQLTTAQIEEEPIDLSLDESVKENDNGKNYIENKFIESSTSKDSKRALFDKYPLKTVEKMDPNDNILLDRMAFNLQLESILNGTR